jgi:CheY-like chemotaxis protein
MTAARAFFTLLWYAAVRIVVADPDAHLLEILQMYLRIRGHQVEAASSSLACLEAIQESQPDVLVLEQELANREADGELLEVLQETQLRQTPIVLVADSRDILENSPLPNVTAWLRKPFRLSHLLDLLNRVTSAANVRNSVVSPLPTGPGNQTGETA